MGMLERQSGFSIDRIIGDMSLWGVLSNESMNVGGDFVILASIAGIAAAPVWGWALPAFLIGSALLVKTTVGVALVAGFGLAEAWRIFTSYAPWPSRQALLAAGVCLLTFVSFFVVSFESNFQLVFAPLYHLRQIVGIGTVHRKYARPALAVGARAHRVEARTSRIRNDEALRCC